MDVNKYYCGAMISVTIDGDVTPCSVIRKGFGNIYEKPLEEIIEEHQKELLFLKLREHKNLPESCYTCKNNTICWGCRAMAFYESGDICGIDPKCFRS
jgi:radical SAM protein with 4Fe4S-binding SPASM domain